MVLPDRAGLVGEDGETHQGLYDLSYLSHIPNMTIAAPADYQEFIQMLDYGILRHNGPFAIRYPRGTGKEMLAQPVGIKPGKGVRILEGKDVTITAVGMMTETALKAAELLSGKGILAEVINARFVKPLDEQLILDSVSKPGALVTLEVNCIEAVWQQHS